VSSNRKGTQGYQFGVLDESRMIKIVVIKCLDGTAKEVSVRTQNSRREDERTTRYVTFLMILSIFLLIWPILVMDRYTQSHVLAHCSSTIALGPFVRLP